VRRGEFGLVLGRKREGAFIAEKRLGPERGGGIPADQVKTPGRPSSGK